MSKCPNNTKNGRHAWTPLHNVTSRTIHLGPTRSFAAFNKKGKYKCGCGEIKFGAPILEPEPRVNALPGNPNGD